MVAPIALGLLSAAPAVAGFLGNLFDSDRSEARRLARESALGRGPTTMAAKAAVQDATRQMVGASRAGSTNPLLSERNAMLAGAELQSRVAPQVAQQQAAEMERGRASLAAMGTQQGQILQQGLGALSGGLAGMTGFLTANPSQPQQPSATPAQPAATPVAPAFGGGPSPLALGGGPLNLGNFASNLSAPTATPAAPAANPSAPGAPGAAFLGGMAGQLQLPPELQGMDPRLLMQFAGRAF